MDDRSIDFNKSSNLLFLYIAQVGVVRMCAFILQTLSSEREFGIKLNTVFTGHSSLPALARLPAFHGTYGDYLVIVS